MMNLRFFSFVFAVALVAPPLLRAADGVSYIDAKAFDAISLLPAPPMVAGSEGRVDLETTLRVHRSAPPAELAQSADENKLTIFHFAPAIGAGFKAGAFPKTEALFAEVE